MADLGLCLLCQRTLNRSNNHRRPSMPLTAELVQAHPSLMQYLSNVGNITDFGVGDRICRPCLQRADRYVPAEPNVLEEPAEQNILQQPAEPNVLEQPAEPNVLEQPADPQILEPAAQPNVVEQPAAVVQGQRHFPFPGYHRAPLNTRVCIFAMCENRHLQRIDKSLRAAILKEKKFFIPFGSRVCEEHRNDSAWQDVERSIRHVYNMFSPKQLMDMVRLLQSHRSHLNFEQLSSINDSIFHYYIGFSKTQFQEMLQSTPSIAENNTRRPATALATVLVKLHTGDSNQRVCSLLRMSRSTFERTMTNVRECLKRDFIPRHLGYDHLSRDEMISRCLAIPNALFGNNYERAITIHDATYMYLQRSTNYYFQRKSYSLHKWRNLYKPYLIVCPDGHIVDVYGPYDATTSDSVILNRILESRDDPFHWVFRPNDVLILDRGFRDSIEPLKSYGYCPKMPITKSSTDTQLTTLEANESRKVTMCRWVVETINGRLKNQFKQLRHTNNNRAMTHLFDEIKIACAILNAFGRPLTDHRLVTDILSEIHQRSAMENHLSSYVIASNLNARRAIFRTITAENLELDSFPTLNTDDLILYALGTYQIKQARSYYGEHTKQNGQYHIEVYREVNTQNITQYGIVAANPVLVRGRIQSRHRQARIYYVYILYEENAHGREAIIGHYCSCIVGKRTLGCCSHAMAIVWYLGWGRHQPNLSPPALFLDSIIVRHDIENEADDPSDDDV